MAPVFWWIQKEWAHLLIYIKWVAWFELFFLATSDRGWFSGADSKPWVHKSRSSFLIKMGLTQIYNSINVLLLVIHITLWTVLVSFSRRVLKLCLKVEALMFAFHRICRQVIWTWWCNWNEFFSILTIIVSKWSLLISIIKFSECSLLRRQPF